MTTFYDVLSIHLSPFIMAYCIFLAILLGLVFGSGLNCLAYRIARGEKWTGKDTHSKCPSCGHVLSTLDLIPVLSWVFLRGKCRYCGEKVSIRYPITEGTLAVVFVSLLLRYDLKVETLVYAVLCACLFTLSLVDLDIQEIPNRFLVIPAVVRLVQVALMEGVGGVWYAVWHGLALGGSVMLLSIIMDKILHKDSMGGGDIKLLAVLGLFFDLPSCLLLLMVACVAGIIIALLLAAQDKAFPFGPALSLAAWLVLLFGQPVVSWYLGFF